ncbi:MAG: hypothetical protein NUV98_06290 [Candidatus Roizmanbacteria bacterium]|nr:hypothetical protein [Candidatus Roizmanbacteria bacterium]
MKYLARVFVIVILLLQSSSLARVIYAQEDSIQFESSAGQSSGYVNLTCDCYANALDIAQTGNPAEGFANAAQCEAAAGNVNAEAWLQHVTNSQAFSIANMIGAVCTSNDPEKRIQEYSKSGLGITNSVIAGLYLNPPASTTYYVADLMEHAGFVEPAYAQGIGYSGLLPFIDIWRVFRNFSYIILIAVAVVIGFMIMLRMNIDPQTVISVQNALPGIAVTLILITFSYAIAGLLIDLMYFLILMIVSIFAQLTPDAGGATEVAHFQQTFLNANMLTLMRHTVWTRNTFALPVEIWQMFIPSGATAGITALFFQSAGPAAWATEGIIAGLPILIITVSLFFAFLRILMILLTSYIQIIINIIFAPLILLRGAIPGSNAFTGWIRTLIGNLSVYPTTAGLILLSKLFTDRVATGTEGGQIWQPPFLLGPSTNSDNLVGLIGLGIALLAPTFILRIKNAIAEKPAIPVSPGVIVGPTASVVGKGIGMYATFRQIGGQEMISGLADKLKRPSAGDPTAGATGQALGGGGR